MPLLHIDDRLAGLADAATRVALTESVAHAPHRKVLSVAAGENSLDATAALELAGTTIEAAAFGDADGLRGVCAQTIHARTPNLDANSLTEFVTRSTHEGPPAFSSIDVMINSLIVAELNMSAERRISATHTGTLQVGWAAIEATGRSIVLDGVLVGHLTAEAADDIDEFVFDDLHLYYDTTTLLTQLALV